MNGLFLMFIIPLARFCFTFIFECSPVFKGWIFQLAMLNYQRIDRCFVALIAEVCQCHGHLPFQVPPLPFANAGPAKKARWPVGCLGFVLYYSRSMKKWAHSKKGYSNLWYLMMGCWIITFHIDMASMGVSSMSGRTHIPSQRRHRYNTHTHILSLRQYPQTAIKSRGNDDSYPIHLHIWSYP